jgi:hypothetical protein
MPHAEGGSDSLSRVGATYLAAKIEEYWKGRGFNGIRAAAYEIRDRLVTGTGSSIVFGVRSNIGPNGFPPK